MTPQTCVILVPVGGNIEPDCERGLHQLEKRGYQVRRAFGFSAIDFGRSVLASQALRDGFDELLWIDSDVGFAPNDVEKLRGRGLPLCCGLYPKKDAKSFACHFLPGTDRIVFGRRGGLHEVLYCGFGFVHVRREVFERMNERIGLPECNQRFGTPITPWFMPELVPDGAGWWYLAEDYAFCHRARKCGYKIIADTTIRLTHVGRHSYCWESFGEPRPRYTNLELRLGGAAAAPAGPGSAPAGDAVRQVMEPPPNVGQVVPGPAAAPEPDAEETADPPA